MAQRGIGLLLGHGKLAIKSRTVTDISKILVLLAHSGPRLSWGIQKVVPVFCQVVVLVDEWIDSRYCAIPKASRGIR